MNENRRVARATSVIGGATLFSRLFGYIRDMVLAGFLGAGRVSDAFFVAFTIPNLMRRLFAEGSLTIAFIPVFTEQLQKKGRAEAFAMAGSALRLLSVILLVVTVVGVLLSPAIVHVVGWGWTVDQPEKFELTVTLTRIMFPYVFFICLVALCMGILNALGYFAAPALAPVLLNVAMIAAIGGVSVLSDDALVRVKGLAVGVVVGGIMQLALQVPFLIRAGLSFRTKAALYHPALKKVGYLMLPAVFGAAVYQINIIVGRMLATMLPEGSVSYLYYADRLVQFPLGVFAISGAMAALPSMSRQAAAGDYEAVVDTFSYSLKLIFFISLPAMTGLIVLREPMVALLFQHGKFGDEAVRLTAYALLLYAAGLWAVSAVRILVSAFYALSDTRTPVRIAVIATLANIVFSLALMGPLGHGGLALATSLAAVLNFGLLLRALQVKLGWLGLGALVPAVVRYAFSSAVMGLAVWQVSLRVIPPEAGLAGQLLGMVFCVGVGVACYLILSYSLHSRELKDLIKALKKTDD
ncbi:MAG: murein biosynthesis integral membrane protein MurJ [Desulfosudaceae bacterium]